MGDGGITVSGNFPKTMAPGSDAVIEIKIVKGNSSGFAKLQIEIPEGMSIAEVDNKGANFSNVDGFAKWIWSSLPTSQEIVIKFKLIAGSGVNGVKPFTAKYSYVDNNVKQVVEMTPVEVAVGNVADSSSAKTESASSAPAAPISTPTSSVSATPTSANDNTNSTNQNATVVNSTTNSNNSTSDKENTTITTPTSDNTHTSPNAEPVGDLKIERNISKGKNKNELLVSIKIKKESTKGFARYSDDLPENVTATAIQSDGASFSVADGKVKFIWVEVPTKTELNLSYNITSNTSQNIEFKGDYTYLEQNQSKKIKLTPETIEIGAPESVTEKTTQQAPATQPEVKETNVLKTQDTPANPPVTNQEKATSPQVQPEQSTNSNIKYRVQIGAFTNANVTSGQLSRQFRIGDKITSEMSGGYSKFMVGSYEMYKQAHDKRDVLKANSGINNAFVVAYNGANRISVQEALMASNQKWLR